MSSDFKEPVKRTVWAIQKLYERGGEGKDLLDKFEGHIFIFDSRDAAFANAKKFSESTPKQIGNAYHFSSPRWVVYPVEYSDWS